jgi:glucokinase
MLELPNTGRAIRLLAGDVGGTKTLLQLVDVTPDGRTIVLERRFESGKYGTFDDLLDEFVTMRHDAPVDSACFGVAGPVFRDRAEVTNLGWVMEAATLASRFGIRRVTLINDFYAVALAVPLLGDRDFVSLQAGRRDPFGPIGILGAGTGLGEAIVIYDGARWNVVPSEGGHADFAPQDEEQARLFLKVHEKYGHVSWERVLSGMGLVNIHNFVAGTNRPYDDTIPGQIAAAAAKGDAAAAKTMAIFVDLYGAEAGNMALRILAHGGVFLAGGIAAKNLPLFTDGRFVQAFLRKGRFRLLLADIPVNLITNPSVGVIGAAEMASRKAMNDER